jgi:rod shape-determining protein MreB
MVICLGGGTTQVGVLAMNSIIAAELERVGWQQVDWISRLCAPHYGVILSRFSAEIVKMRIGAAIEGLEEVKWKRRVRIR